MKLTQELAEKYAAYRDRFLGGSMGIYDGFRTDITDPCPSGDAHRRYTKNGYVPFMVIAGDPSTDVGTFLHIDRTEVADASAEELEDSEHKLLHFGDNTVYSPLALVCFAGEYSITRLAQPLEFALAIVRSFARLGSHQRGFQEMGAPPFGFILRHDSHDEATASENFCKFESGAGPAAKQLAPSLDQYSSLLACLSWAKTIVEDTPADPPNAALRSQLISAISERVERIVHFVAFDTIYTIRWEASGAVRQPDEDRGPYCHAVAYPFARIASRVINGSPNHHLDFLGELGMATVIDLTVVLLDKISQAIRDEVVPFIREHFVEHVRGTIGAAVWDTFAELLDVAAIVVDQFNNHVLVPVIERIIDPIIQQISDWGGTPVTTTINDLWGQFLFDLFVTGVLLDTSDKPLFQDSQLKISVAQVLQLIGDVPLPSSIPIDVDIEFKPSKPGWWNETILGDWPAPEFETSIATFDIDLTRLLDFTVSIPMSGLLRKLVAVAKGKAYLKFLAFNLLSASDTFGAVPDTDPRELAFKYDNAWFMAIAHRFHGAGLGEPGVLQTLNILATAPDNFPKGKGSSHWNQDFRWIRDIETKDTSHLYSGLDYMAPLMVAASALADLADNRDVLLTALSTKVEEDADMGHFRLPFQGPISNKVVFEPHAGGTQNDTVIYVGVLFDRTVGNGIVTLTVPKLDGGTEDVEFRQDDRRALLIAAPLTESGIVIKSASPTAKGAIVVAPSP